MAKLKLGKAVLSVVHGLDKCPPHNGPVAMTLGPFKGGKTFKRGT